jgi:hypothetical protein
LTGCRHAVFFRHTHSKFTSAIYSIELHFTINESGLAAAPAASADAKSLTTP